jgi:DNA-binding NarL/FixJ family response regulator
MKSSGTKREKDNRTRSLKEPLVQGLSPNGQLRRKAITHDDRYREIFSSAEVQGGGAVLTSKELQLLELLSYGYENGDIADHFQTSLQAVKNMLRTINLKLGADNRTHAVSICFRNDWLPLKNTSDDGLPQGQAVRTKSRN